MLCLTSGAMTEFAIERCVSTELILNFPAVAASFILDIEMLVRALNAVGWTGLPVVLAFY